MYDNFYNILIELEKQYNPCNWKDNICRRGTPCCSNCRYLSSTGCTTMALGCKLWYCDVIRQSPELEEFNRKVKEVLRDIQKNNIPIKFRSSKEEHLNDSPYDNMRVYIIKDNIYFAHEEILFCRVINDILG
jgi:hypothetical protein